MTNTLSSVHAPFTTSSSPNFTKAQGRRLHLVDFDGTVIEGSELRNRIILQAIVNRIVTHGSLPKNINELNCDALDAGENHPDNNIPENGIALDWSEIAGRKESQILEWVQEKLESDTMNKVSANAFTNLAKQGYEALEADHTPREGLIEMLLAERAKGHAVVLVTNSHTDYIEKALPKVIDHYNAANGTHITADDVFEMIVTRSDMDRLGLNAKPAPDPYLFAMNRFNFENGTNYTPSDVVAHEDSPTGLRAASAAGMRCIIYNSLKYFANHAHWHVKDVAQARAIIDGTEELLPSP